MNIVFPSETSSLLSLLVFPSRLTVIVFLTNSLEGFKIYEIYLSLYQIVLVLKREERDFYVTTGFISVDTWTHVVR